MLATERRRKILEHVRAVGVASLRDLARLVQASEVTVRRDLTMLEEQGLLDRHRGGAAVTGDHPRNPADHAARSPATQEKIAIAELASTLVHDGDSLALGAGTTVELLADRLVAVKDLTVVTNSLLVGEALGRSTAGAVVVMTGGSLRGSTYGLVGSGAEESFADLRVRRAFLSGDGLTSTWGLSSTSLSQAGVDRAIADAAQEILVLADHSKLGVDAMFQTVSREKVAHLITDDLADPELLEAFAAARVHVHVAPVQRQSVTAARSARW